MANRLAACLARVTSSSTYSGIDCAGASTGVPGDVPSGGRSAWLLLLRHQSCSCHDPFEVLQDTVGVSEGSRRPERYFFGTTTLHGSAGIVMVKEFFGSMRWSDSAHLQGTTCGSHLSSAPARLISGLRTFGSSVGSGWKRISLGRTGELQHQSGNLQDGQFPRISNVDRIVDARFIQRSGLGEEKLLILPLFDRLVGIS